MSALTFRLRQAPGLRVNLAPLVPQKLAGLKPSAIPELELPWGNAAIKVGDLFDVSGSDPSRLVFEGGSPKLDRIGEAMGSGEIIVRGDAGAYLGHRMAGGAIRVEGSVGDYCASGAKNGLVTVTGHAGDFLAAALPGEHRGMAGGLVLIRGNAGDRVGDRMRRGMVLIEGGAGDYCASRMGAGTIAVLGRTGAGAATGMRRGTLLLKEPPELPPTFNDCGVHQLGFLQLLYRSWASLPGRFAELPAGALTVRRRVGDLGNEGKGEVLVWV